MKEKKSEVMSFEELKNCGVDITPAECTECGQAVLLTPFPHNPLIGICQGCGLTYPWCNLKQSQKEQITKQEKEVRMNTVFVIYKKTAEAYEIAQPVFRENNIDVAFIINQGVAYVPSNKTEDVLAGLLKAGGRVLDDTPMTASEGREIFIEL